MEVLGLRNPQIVTDGGYWSEANITELCRAHLDFIALGRPAISWISREAVKVLDSIHCPKNLAPDSSVYVATIPVKHALSYQRKYASTKKNLKPGDTEKFTRRLYLHVCFDPIRKEHADVRFFERLRDLKRDLEQGIPLAKMTKKANEYAQKYLDISIAQNVHLKSIGWNSEACIEACRFHGVFVIVANREKDGFAALQKYRRREEIEEFFRLDRNAADGARPRVWHADTLMGRMLVQVAALCYADYLRFRIHGVIETLQNILENPEGAGRTKDELKIDRSLLAWLKKTSFYGILQWFDAYEDIVVSESIRKRRWNPQTSWRDRRFLSLLMDG